jgi:chorismate mutase
MARPRDREPTEMLQLRRKIDALDRKIVGLLSERTELARSVGAVKAGGGRAIRDAEREREVLLRVTMANAGPLAQADLLAIYRRLMAATRALQQADAARRPIAGGPLIDATGGEPAEREERDEPERAEGPGGGCDDDPSGASAA